MLENRSCIDGQPSVTNTYKYIRTYIK